MANGRTASTMVWVVSCGQMEVFTKESGVIVERTAEENFRVKMVHYMKANGWMESITVEASCKPQMARFLQEHLRTVNF